MELRVTLFAGRGKAALSEDGFIDVVLKVLQNEEYPGHGYWIANGMTTLCETWDMKMSLNHQMYAAIDSWFYKYIAGIKYEQNFRPENTYFECKKGMRL